MTGTEALQHIIEKLETLTLIVDDLKSSIKLIEGNIKVLNNRAGGLLLQNNKIEPEMKNNLTTIEHPNEYQIPPTMRNANIATLPTTTSPSKQMFKPALEESDGIITYKKIFGKLINSNNEPIENVLIKVYDKNNEVCATTESDLVGYWESMVRPGKYVAEYIKDGFKSENKTFEVNKNSNEVQVK